MSISRIASGHNNGTDRQQRNNFENEILKKNANFFNSLADIDPTDQMEYSIVDSLLTELELEALRRMLNFCSSPRARSLKRISHHCSLVTIGIKSDENIRAILFILSLKN